MIDFHCHLDLFPNPQKIAFECDKRGLYILAMTTTPSAWEGSNELGIGYNRIKTALGLHPQLAKEREHELVLFDRLITRVKYVGEIGLDGTPELKQTWVAQQRVFEHILRSCQNNGGKIMSIHSRRAVKQTLNFLNKYPNSGIPILHWYSGNLTDLEKAVKMGCWFSINYPMLKSKSGLKIIAKIPRNRIITETDAPFTGENEKPYNPWDVELVFQKLSVAWNTSLDNTKKQVWENCKNLLTLI